MEGSGGIKVVSLTRGNVIEIYSADINLEEFKAMDKKSIGVSCQRHRALYLLFMTNDTYR